MRADGQGSQIRPRADTPRYRREPAGAHPPLDYPPYKSTQLRHPKQPLVYLPHTVTEITGPQLAASRAHGRHRP